MPNNNSALIQMCIGAVVTVAAYFLFHHAKKSCAQHPNDKRKKRGRLWSMILLLAGAWFTVGRALTWIFSPEPEQLEVSIFAPTMNLFGWEVSSTIVITWAVMLAIILAALAFRIFAVPRFQDKPHGLQNALEICIEAVGKFTKDRMPYATDTLTSYIFSVASLLIGCALAELFGVRPPTADLVMTFSLALITFFLINYYGIKQKGVGGRIRSLARPSPVIFPMKVLSDIAMPVSLACRLFGNMLGGMIVMDLLKVALGANGVGIPSVAGLYFNIFHPLIQTYIFITLSLTFMNEATE